MMDERRRHGGKMAPETSHYPIGHDSNVRLARARVTLSVSQTL